MKNAIMKAAFELKTLHVCEKRSKNGGILTTIRSLKDIKLRIAFFSGLLHFVKTDFTSFPDFLLIGDILMPLLIISMYVMYCL